MLPIFVINLDRRPDRMEGITARLAALGLSPQRIAAIDAKAEDFPARAAGMRRNGPLGTIGDGMIACALSHAKSWESVIDSGAPHAVVLEDDADCAPELPAFLEAFAEARPDLPLVKLERFHNERGLFLERGGPEIAGRRLARLHSIHAGGAAYILSRAGAAHCLKRFETIDLPIDHFLFNPVRGSVFRELGVHQVVPALVRQGKDLAGASDTVQSRQIGQKNRWYRMKYHFNRGLHEIRPALRIGSLYMQGKLRLERLSYG